MTIAYDSFRPVEDELIEQTSEHIDLVKFGLSTPLILAERKRV